jgi:ABC-type glycerol-3-phosphate transport system permease component
MPQRRRPEAAPRPPARAASAGPGSCRSLYILFLMLPIYWLVNMSFKTTNEILGTFSLWPQNFTLANYRGSSPIRSGTGATSTR